MLPNDVFRNRVREVIADLEHWCFEHTLIAQIDRESSPAFWRLSATPAATNACSIELIIHHASQHFDIAIGTETYEALGVATLDQLLPLCHAVEAGRVLTRTWSSLLTRAPHSVESHVHLDDGTTWSNRRLEPTATGIAVAHCSARDRHYAPWQRARAAAA